MNLRWERVILIALIMLSVSSAYVLEFGDGGEAFAKNKTDEMCRSDALAVYSCLGNVVKAVSPTAGEGSTFYKPDGKVIRCPVVPPSEMGAECLQLMMPNYCPEQAECGDAPVQIFPGQNDTPEQTGDVGYYVEDSAPQEPIVEPEPYVPEPAKQKPLKPPAIEGGNTEALPGASPAPYEFALDNLAIVVLFLGVASVGVLFLLFKNSLQE